MGELRDFIQDIVKECIKEEFGIDNNDIPYKDDVFDLTKISIDILRKNYVSYSLYRLSAGYSSPLFVGSDGSFLTEGIDYKGNAEDACREIMKYYPIDVNQVAIVEGHHGIFAAILVANIRGNVDLITACMRQFNLFPARKTPNKTLLGMDGMEWVDIRFEPIEQDDITDEIRKKYKFLYHLFPILFKEKILNHGLNPSNGNPDYKYATDRLYLIEGNVSEKNIKDLASTLYSQAAKKGIKNFSPDYALYKIDLKKVPRSIRFYYDVNEEFGIFTTKPIPPVAIKYFKKIVATD